jgi:hypothetical protein
VNARSEDHGEQDTSARPLAHVVREGLESLMQMMARTVVYVCSLRLPCSVIIGDDSLVDDNRQ